MRPAKLRAMIAFLSLLAAGAAEAQLDRSSLTGTVTDSQGGRVPGVKVRLVEQATGLEREAYTSRGGTYYLDSLPIGKYVAVFSKQGFGDVRVETLHQDIGPTRTLDVRLQVTQTSQKTTVTDSIAQMDRTSAVLGSSIERTQLEELPLNGRNWAHLTALAPGAIDTGASDQRTIRFAGHGLDDNNFTFDGVDATGILNQAQKEYVRLAIPLESISAFQVQAQNFNADSGTTAGGQVAVASAAGTNSLRGSLFEYLRNDVLDSRSPFDGASPAPLVLNQFGASLGGAFVPNKLFFFANYEGLRQRLGQVQNGLVPSASFRALAGPASPAALISEYPAGTIATSDPNVSRYVEGTNQVDNEDSGTVRLDDHFTSTTTGFLRFSQDEADYVLPTGALNARSETDTRLKNGVAEVLHVFSPTLINEAKFGINQDIYHTANSGTTPFSVKVSGFSSLTNNETTDGAGTTFSFIDDTTWVHGQHAIKFGVEVRRIHMYQGNSQNGTLTSLSSLSFLTDKIDNATFAAQLPLKRLRKTQVYSYIQDEYKLRPSLTITLGLRYSFFNVFHEIDNRAIPFDLETCGGFCSPGAEFTHPRFNDLDPRLAVTWAHGNTALRAGGGLYHSDGQEDDQNLPIANDVQRFTLSGVSYPLNSYLTNVSGIVTPRDMYRNRKDFYVAAWTASVQQTLPAQLVGTATYAGNKGTDVLTTTYQNVTDPVTGVRPYAQFGTIEFRKNDSNSTFHALQLNLRRAFQRGWLFSANYMWSHSINDDGIGGGESDTPQDVFCRACEKASSDFDVRHTFNLSAVYQLPFGAGKAYFSDAGIWRALLGGWELNSVATSRSGLPVNVTVDRANSAIPGLYSVSGSERPDLVPGVSLTPAGGQVPSNWINSAAFAQPAPGAFGNAGRNLLRGPNLWQIDASLVRSISLSERVTLQCRAEGYNLLNRGQYGQPSADTSSPQSFGQITTLVGSGATGSGTPRQFQIALKLSF